MQDTETDWLEDESPDERKAIRRWVDADEEANPSRYESVEIEIHTKG